ncbi:MAG TPA: MobF family relaxase [Pseudonocardia sp.]
MTCHVLHAGDGYTYLTNQVASDDIARSAREPLADYYLAAGNPPGEWAGSGVAALGMTGHVTEENMLALFGEGLHPNADALITGYITAGMPFAKAVDRARLGRRFYRYSEPDIPLVAAVRAGYDQFETAHARRPDVAERRVIKERVAGELLAGPGGTAPAPEVVRKYLADELGKASQPVAGVDLVFSPVKSVSVLWGLGEHQVRQVIEQVHEAAWKQALAYGEREAGYTRIGKNGVAQIDTHGFVATAFVHRDSRAGDPDLHTHVAVANRVLGVDGQWRTLDSQQIHKIAVSMSEVYNAALEQGLTERLGVAWTEVAKGAGKRGVREVAGVPDELISGFSRRRTQVEKQYDDLVADYVARYGHTPPRSVQMQLAQQATLTGRPDKKAGKTLQEQVDAWTAAAAKMLPGQNVDQVLAAALGRTVAAAEPVDVAELAAHVVDVVSEHRASWTVYHVRAEAIRQLKPYSFAAAADREQATERVVAAALGTESLELGLATTATPALLQRASGESIYHRHGSTRYTSHAILNAETRLLTAAGQTAGPVVPLPAARAAIAAYETDSGRTLNPGQRQLVEQFVTSGRALSVGIGPPGTGKSTAMRAVRAAWESTGNRVLGLAPSAAAASVLGDELGIPADTLHRLVLAHDNGAEVDVRAGDMLLVDEAGMAGTRLLDRVRAIAAEHGAVVRLVGDYRQLAAVEAGGALRLIHGDHGGTELVQVHRFRDPAEAAAVLALRVGDPACLDFYTAQDRLHGGTRAAVLDELYGAWRADTAAGRTAIMISDSTEIARELSARAQLERRATGLAETGGVRLHDATTAGVGDRIVTRHNNRRLAVLGGADYVKNGDLWDVAARHSDGALTVRHARHGGKITLPGWYVGEHVELGYAATIHRSQGLTVDISRAYLTPLAAREAALVALSRGTEANHAYLDTETVLATDEPEVLPGDLFYRHREHDPVAQAFATIIRREGAELSATEQLRAALDHRYRLDAVVPQYLHAVTIYRGPDAAAEAAQWVRQAVPEHAADVLADPAWPALAATLLEIGDIGTDPAALLAARAAQRPLDDDPGDPARSIAQVLHYRLALDLPTATSGATADPGRSELLPGWVSTPPAADVSQPAELGRWLREQADAIADRVRHLGEQAAEHTPAWSIHLGPVPHDPLERDSWIAAAGQVAAYRERFGLADEHPELLPGGEHGDAARARAWVAHHLVTPATELADVDQAQQHEPDRTDLSPGATWERMARWRAEHEHTYSPASDPDAPGELDQVRQDYSALALEVLQARVTGDPPRLATAQAAMAEFTARHRDEVQVIREDARAALDRLEADRERASDIDRDQRRQDARDAWEARPHSMLTDRQLATAITQQQQRGARAEQRQADAAARLSALAPQVEAGRGPRVHAVDTRVRELSVRAGLAAEYTELARQLGDVQRESGMATAQASGKAWEAERVTRWESIRHPGRRDELRAEADDLRAAAARAETAGAQLRGRMQELAEQAGGPGELHRAPFEARVAVDHHDRDRHAARAADQRDVDQLRRQVDQFGGAAGKAGTIVTELRDEQQLRADMPQGQRIRETGFRTTWNIEQAARDAERQQRQAERRRELDHERRYEPPHISQHNDRGPGMSL